VIFAQQMVTGVAGRQPTAWTWSRTATRRTQRVRSGSTSNTTTMATAAPRAVSSRRSSSELENSSSCTYTWETSTVIPMAMKV
jgi:hypothetical protein